MALYLGKDLIAGGGSGGAGTGKMYKHFIEIGVIPEGGTTVVFNCETFRSTNTPLNLSDILTQGSTAQVPTSCILSGTIVGVTGQIAFGVFANIDGSYVCIIVYDGQSILVELELNENYQIFDTVTEV